MIEAELRVEAPYRLDLTVAVLRRFSTNVVDVTSSAGAYVRALGDARAPVVARVVQTADDALAVRLWCAPDATAGALGSLRRILGTERRTPRFDEAARAIPWLAGIAARMRGVRPPRYPSLWEACVNAIVFQQISLHAASAILRRTILAIEPPVRVDGSDVRCFPAPERMLAAPETVLRAAGLSSAKIATLRLVAAALADGTLNEPMLERLSSAEAALQLRCMRGVGPWTAALVLLRGLGRLDVFPAKDSGVARSSSALGFDASDVPAALETLGPERGMLYFHLLLARLEASGELGAGDGSLNAECKVKIISA